MMGSLKVRLRHVFFERCESHSQFEFEEELEVKCALLSFLKLSHEGDGASASGNILKFIKCDGWIIPSAKKVFTLLWLLHFKFENLNYKM